MKRTLIAVLSLAILSTVIVSAIVFSPTTGAMIAVAALIAGGATVFKPLPPIGLGNRALALLVAAIGLSGLLFARSIGDATGLAGLKEVGTDIYLAALRNVDRGLWLDELEEIRPDAFQAELARQTEEAERRAETLLQAISDGRWELARSYFERLRGDDLRPAYGELETAIIKALPSISDDDAERRLIAFTLLSELRPEQAAYRKRAEQYRRTVESQAAIADSRAAEAEKIAKICERPSNGVTALVVAQLQYIKPKIRSPSTASFPSYADDDVLVTFLNECTFVVRTYVDAQNAFGAVIRTRFVVTVQRDVKYPDTWRLVDMYTLD